MSPLSLAEPAEQQIYRAPPYLGQHTDEVLKELGYRDDEIRNMKEGKVV